MTDRLSLGPEAVEDFKAHAIQIYARGRLWWVVDDRDLVYVNTQKGKKPTGYNHSRAWRCAMTPYSPYTNPEDVDVLTEAEVQRIMEIIDGPTTVKRPKHIEIKE